MSETEHDSSDKSCVFTFGIKADPHTKDEAIAFACAGVGPGWHPMVRLVVDRMDFYCAAVRIGQVKEKFGGLRFYADVLEMRERPGYMRFDPDQWISAMEALSYHVCEACGRAGECKPVRPGSNWVATLCEACRAERPKKVAAAWEAVQ